MKRWRGGSRFIPDPGLSRRAAALGLASIGLTNPARAEGRLALAGRYQQGGFAIGRAAPDASVSLDGRPITRASPAGFFVIGFDRDAPAQSRLKVAGPGPDASRTLEIARGDFDVQRITHRSSPYRGQASAELEARIADESRRKAAAFASRTDRDDFRDGFSAPLRDFRVSAQFGGQRIVNGKPRPPHHGVDLAAPRGTPVRAPAGGLVLLAEPDMLFEGGLIMIDHGQGLVGAYLHLSQVDVTRGRTVSRGERIGAVGATGRATGPHLCWRLKWRSRNMDPLLMVGARAPA